MIDHLEGNLVEKTPTYAVIDCHGVGYSVIISLNTYSMLPESGKCKLMVEQLYVRDDLPKWFGFSAAAERQLFRHLTSVSGVGGTSAIMMLSSLTAIEIQDAILSADVVTLKRIKGIGEKTAQRIIVDLKGKLGKSPVEAGGFLKQSANPIREEALSALVMLGFAKNIAEKHIDKVFGSMSDQGSVSVEELIKLTLKQL